MVVTEVILVGSTSEYCNFCFLFSEWTGWPTGYHGDQITKTSHCTGSFAIVVHRHSNTITSTYWLDIFNVCPCALEKFCWTFMPIGKAVNILLFLSLGNPRRTEGTSPMNSWRRVRVSLAYRWAPTKGHRRRVWPDTVDLGRSLTTNKNAMTRNMQSKSFLAINRADQAHILS